MRVSPSLCSNLYWHIRQSPESLLQNGLCCREAQTTKKSTTIKSSTEGSTEKRRGIIDFLIETSQYRIIVQCKFGARSHELEKAGDQAQNYEFPPPKPNGRRTLVRLVFNFDQYGIVEWRGKKYNAENNLKIWSHIWRGSLSSPKIHSHVINVQKLTSQNKNSAFTLKITIQTLNFSSHKLSQHLKMFRFLLGYSILSNEFNDGSSSPPLPLYQRLFSRSSIIRNPCDKVSNGNVFALTKIQFVKNF